MYATVRANATIDVRHADGSQATQVAPGSYTIQVTDESASHNFHLTGPGMDRSTQVSWSGTVTWSVTLSAGTYTFVCDPHNEFMRGSFTVSTGLAPPPPPAPTSATASAARHARSTDRHRPVELHDRSQDAGRAEGRRRQARAVHDRGPRPVERAQFPLPGVGREQDDHGRLRGDAEVVGHPRSGHVPLPVRSACDDDERSPHGHRGQEDEGQRIPGSTVRPAGNRQRQGRSVRQGAHPAAAPIESRVGLLRQAPSGSERKAPARTQGGSLPRATGRDRERLAAHVQSPCAALAGVNAAWSPPLPGRPRSPLA